MSDTKTTLRQAIAVCSIRGDPSARPNSEDTQVAEVKEGTACLWKITRQVPQQLAQLACHMSEPALSCVRCALFLVFLDLVNTRL